ncbi:hypothetical protein UFOVP411_32 [uncultured Caudovirales phage]|uniref:Uncharacterized protein n=1 Tax=uncultured Caudovirales phage TaxID=2100421 RepID=A0A6J5M6G2_9CAUD|nr:hypothetical protein UFOVP411_32 [uncultured Caudovirales phage]
MSTGAATAAAGLFVRALAARSQGQDNTCFSDGRCPADRGLVRDGWAFATLHGYSVAFSIADSWVTLSWAGWPTLTTQRRLRALDRALRADGYTLVGMEGPPLHWFTLAEGRAGTTYTYQRGIIE